MEHRALPEEDCGLTEALGLCGKVAGGRGGEGVDNLSRGERDKGRVKGRQTRSPAPPPQRRHKQADMAQ